jgi:hypothetical protein
MMMSNKTVKDRHLLGYDAVQSVKNVPILADGAYDKTYRRRAWPA